MRLPFPTDRLDVPTLLHAYRMGVFPMASDRHAPTFAWYAGMERDGRLCRAHLPLDRLVLSRSLAKTLRQKRFSVSVDEGFEAVIRACADLPRRGQRGTWISQTLIDGYCALFDAGIAHCVTCRDAQGALAGGLYGVQVGGVFCGESVVSLAPDAGKVALVHLVARLWRGGFDFLETQQVTPLTGAMGGVWIDLPDYLDLLEACRDNSRASFALPGLSEAQILDSYLAFLKRSQ
jgi:leucyl/phenylalanyl-tRNA--protein transferase